MRNILAIIPARGGSKGIPRKNLIPFRGEPLLVHSIRHARASTLVTRVVVSTEDPEIAEVAVRHGAEVPFLRPKELAEDQTLDFPVFLHVLETLRATEGYCPELVVHLRPTTPHRLNGWIDDGIRRLSEHPEADSLRSVSLVEQHPYRMFTLGRDGLLYPLLPQVHPTPYVLRRQELPPVFYYNCVLDIAWARTVIEKGSMTGTSMLPLVLDADQVIDIDTPADLRIAECLFGSGAQP